MGSEFAQPNTHRTYQLEQHQHEMLTLHGVPMARRGHLPNLPRVRTVAMQVSSLLYSPVHARGFYYSPEVSPFKDTSWYLCL